MLARREQIDSGQRAPKRPIAITNSIGGRCGVAQGVLWPDCVNKAEKDMGFVFTWRVDMLAVVSWQPFQCLYAVQRTWHRLDVSWRWRSVTTILLLCCMNLQG